MFLRAKSCTMSIPPVCQWPSLFGNFPLKMVIPKKGSLFLPGSLNSCGIQLGPPVVLFYPFWGEGCPKIDDRKSWYPHSILSTAGPSQYCPPWALVGFSPTSDQVADITQPTKPGAQGATPCSRRSASAEPRLRPPPLLGPLLK